jgi:hypothetical protein
MGDVVARAPFGGLKPFEKPAEPLPLKWRGLRRVHTVNFAPYLCIILHAQKEVFK